MERLERLEKLTCKVPCSSIKRISRKPVPTTTDLATAAVRVDPIEPQAEAEEAHDGLPGGVSLPASTGEITRDESGPHLVPAADAQSVRQTVVDDQLLQSTEHNFQKYTAGE